ncbi:MAG: efflux RND transporter periplasmic adaptor subunit, partial [Polyangiales bacterium]
TSGPAPSPSASGASATVNPLEAEMVGAARKRLELMGVPADEIAAIEATGKVPKTVGIRATSSGYVVQKAAVAGMYAQAGTELFTIADLSRVWVIADVYETDLARIAVGQQAHVTVATFPDRMFMGKVRFIYPSIDPITRTAKVRVELGNADLALRPGMFGSVRIELPETETLLVPREAIVDTGEVQYVFVTPDQLHFEPRRVRVAGRVGDSVRIDGGVKEGETVVTTGNFLIDSESRLRASIEATSRGER